MTAILDDLQAEHADLDRLAPGAALDKPTPAEGWTVGDTVGHLWFFDREATTALTDPDAFQAAVEQALTDADAFLARPLDDPRAPGARLPEVWRATRSALLAALGAGDPAV